MTVRNTVTMDIKEDTTRQIVELLKIADDENLRVFKVQLFRVALTILYEKVMESENKGQTLNNLVIEYDK